MFHKLRAQLKEQNLPITGKYKTLGMSNSVLFSLLQKEH